MKHFHHKTAFTMVELVFVIIVAGIIAVIALPRFDRNNLQEAADQVMSHLRYTQHLAMQDDKFDPNDGGWCEQRWQLIFTREAESGDKFSYTIFADTAGGSAGNPDKKEIAKNPLDPTKLLSGGANGLNTTDKEATQEMNLGETYGIKDVRVTGSFGGAMRVWFDYLGRPLGGNQSTMTGAYSPANRLMNAQCSIDLCLTDLCPAVGTVSDDIITIIIEPETGFVRLKN